MNNIEENQSDCWYNKHEGQERKEDKHQKAAKDAAALWHEMLRLPPDADWSKVKRKNMWSRF